MVQVCAAQSHRFLSVDAQLIRELMHPWVEVLHAPSRDRDEHEGRQPQQPSACFQQTSQNQSPLAAGHMLFEFEKSGSYASDLLLPRGDGVSEWDQFAVRNLGLAVQRRMSQEFNSEGVRIRAASVKLVKRALGLRSDRWREAELNALENLALVLAMIRGIERWSADEKQLAAQIIRAKGRGDEARYLRLIQQHPKLRAGIIELGS